MSELPQLRRASRGDSELLGALLSRHRERLERIVRWRLDGRVRGRIDPDDVVQEVFLEAASRLGEYLKKPEVPLFVWLRFLTVQKLIQIHRQHLGVQARDAGREVSIYRGPLLQASSAELAAVLVGKLTSPSQAAEKAEMKLRLQASLDDLAETDREILVLRHFEQLSNSEAARVLNLSDSAACNRYVRAIARLKEALGSNPAGTG